MILVLKVLALDGWRWDEKLALSAALMAIGALAWAFAYTSAEGALRANDSRSAAPARCWCW